MAVPKPTSSALSSWKQLLQEWDLNKFNDQFEENGWTDPSDWNQIDDNDLKQMGLKKGHIVRFKKKLKGKIRQNNNEGSTGITPSVPVINNDDNKNDNNLLELRGGDSWIELGEFRLGEAGDVNHFSISHKTMKKTCIIFRNDGTIHPGPRDDFCLSDKPYIYGLKNVSIGDGYIQFGKCWRMGVINNDHFSIAHISKKTCMIWRSDGTQHKGPRTDFYEQWNRNTQQKTFGTFAVKKNNNHKYVECIQFGTNWRIGSCDFSHFSISALHVYFKWGDFFTAVIYRRDGTIWPGPRNDLGLWQNIVEVEHPQDSFPELGC